MLYKGYVLPDTFVDEVSLHLTNNIDYLFDSFKKGEILGHTKDEFGNILAGFIAFNLGKILYKIGTPPINIGASIMCVGLE